MCCCNQIYIKKIKKYKIDIMQSLYQYDFYQNSFYQNKLKIKNNNTIPNISLFKNIVKNIKLIDEIIKKNIYNYSIDRLNKVDKAIIRLATMELLEKKKSHKIIINDAIEITKEYSSLDDEKQYKFNNKLLHLIYEYINNEKNDFLKLVI
ncbi:transcription antitermination protein NusB [Candidatus Phytoplasma sacchari]|uniref:Transcription antitermination protein NusB n=1 Tax=Candidatus Phytoplasma sacchari TaxID=2609813 RepID=A0ABY7M0N9_9MOLU|nr:transcription antitermination protein NusB [Candidatus Phytoplasma sacchari]